MGGSNEVNCTGVTFMIIQEDSSFPRNLFRIKSWTGGRIIAAMIAFFCFFKGYNFFFHYSYLKTAYIPFIGSAIETSRWFFHLFIIALGYLILWFAFDRRALRHTVSGLLWLSLGALYMISPVDFSPDIIPFVGTLDDLIVALVCGYVGFSNFSAGKASKENYLRMISALKNDDKNEALRVLLEEKGVTIREASDGEDDKK